MRLIAVLVLALLLAGCVGDAPQPTPSPSPTQSPAPKPRLIFSGEGNPPPCTQVLRDDRSFDFTLEEGYDQIEVVFHADGVGQAGWKLYGPDGALLRQRDHDPQNQPCGGHGGHMAQGQVVDSRPGPHRIVVNNLGIVSWQLIVNAKSSNATGAGHAH